MMLVKNRFRWAVTFSFAICAALAFALMQGCSAGVSGEENGASENIEVQNTLHAGSTTYFYAESMDPASEWDSWYLSYYGIVENLFRVGDDLTPEPWLAKSAERIDEYTWNIVLNEGITFSNGEKVDAQAVKAAWERTYKENKRAEETLPYKSIKAKGNELEITTKNIMPSLENTLCDPLLCVYFVGDDIDYSEFTPATGPYVKKEFVAEDHIVLSPNENYWNGNPKLAEVTLTCFADDNAMTMAIQNGEIQAIAMPSASTLTTLAGEEAYDVLKSTTSRADFIRMNMEHEVMKDDAIRQAVALCIDRDGYANVICQGSAVACWGVYSATLPFGGTEGLNVKIEECDYEKASQILEDAGYKDSDGDGIREMGGKAIELDLYVCTKYERFVNIADDLQSKLLQAGVRLNIVPTDYFLEDAETFAKDDPDMTLDSYAMAPTGNQAYFANMSFASGASNNFGKYSNKEVDSLIKNLDQTFNESERNDIARQISQIVLDDLPYIFFANSESTVVCDKSVVGLDAAPSEYYFVTVDTARTQA